MFDVENDPSESYPLAWSKGAARGHAAKADAPTEDDLAALLHAKKGYETSLFVRAISPEFGRQWAVCCNAATNCTCTTPTPLPIPPPLAK
jgi:hypothetical protein